MTVVIPYREDHHKGLELSYCIKGIRKFMVHDNIVVVGDSGIITKQQRRKQWDIVCNIKAACDSPLVSDPFICMSDDVFLLKPYGFTWYYHNGPIDENAKGQRRIINQNTLAAGCELNFDIHRPIKYHKSLFVSYVYDNFPNDRLIQSMYCRCINPDWYVRVEDYKIRSRMKYADIMAYIKDKPMFSTHPAAINDDMKRVLEELYA